MDNTNRTQALAARLASGTAVLSPLELNEIRFSDKKTVISPQMLKRIRRAKRP